MTEQLSVLQKKPVRTAGDLARLWGAMMGDGGFGRRSLWLVRLAPDGVPLPAVVPIDDIPYRPQKKQLRGLTALVDYLPGPGSLVMLLSRPGLPRVQPADREWARALAPLGPDWPVHLAAADDDGVGVILAIR